MGKGDFLMKKKLFIFLSLIFLSFIAEAHAADPPDFKLDAELKTIWTSMVTALTKKDIEGALDNFTYSSRWRYREQFRQAADKLPEMVSDMRNIEKVYIKLDEAKYRLRLQDNGKEYTSYIWFSKDILGRWKIDKF